MEQLRLQGGEDNGLMPKWQVQGDKACVSRRALGSGFQCEAGYKDTVLNLAVAQRKMIATPPLEPPWRPVAAGAWQSVATRNRVVQMATSSSDQ